VIWVFLLAVVLIVFLVSKSMRGTPGVVAKQSPSGNRIFYSQVHGIRHKNDDGTSRQRIIEACHEGEELVLVPEPDNRFDPGAIKICRRNGEQLGYWSGNGRMARDLAIVWTYRVTIDEIYPFAENRRKHGVRLRVEVLTMSRKTEARKSARHNPGGST
jgi:hypothetical protein